MIKLAIVSFVLALTGLSGCAACRDHPVACSVVSSAALTSEELTIVWEEMAERGGYEASAKVYLQRDLDAERARREENERG